MFKLDVNYLEVRAAKMVAAGYSIPKWIIFCDRLLRKDLNVELYEAKSTVSKYIHISNKSKKYKVRISNHKPSYTKEMDNDCDYFVGVTYTGVRTTNDAYNAVLEHFKGE